jgi:hypothetical protein
MQSIYNRCINQGRMMEFLFFRRQICSVTADSGITTPSHAATAVCCCRFELIRFHVVPQ